MGGTSWKESITSGEALAGEGGSGTFGTINSSALEQSNVNLTSELIDLISAQRNFQANSRALEVDNQLNCKRYYKFVNYLIKINDDIF